ncbi:MAG: hypothetical protein KAX65_06315 [Caldilineaceae bacterium]|nr:hypothetical protein [Caldilineaceae bacterium]
MRNRAAIPIDAALSEQAQPAPATWQSDVLIPLTTNALSGVAWAGGAAIAWYWAAGGEMPDVWLAACGSIGAIWAIAWTVIRYNGDEIGLFRAAYSAGRRSRDAEVNHLRMQLETYRDAVTAASGGATTTEAEKRIAIANATLKNARALLRVIYEHGARHATREEMAERQMGQRDWERAKALCIAAGVVDAVLQPQVGDYAAALKRVEEVHGAGVAELRKSKRGGLAWS